MLVEVLPNPVGGNSTVLMRMLQLYKAVRAMNWGEITISSTSPR